MDQASWPKIQMFVIIAITCERKQNKRTSHTCLGEESLEGLMDTIINSPHPIHVAVCVEKVNHIHMGEHVAVVKPAHMKAIFSSDSTTISPPLFMWPLHVQFQSQIPIDLFTLGLVSD